MLVFKQEFAKIKKELMYQIKLFLFQKFYFKVIDAKCQLLHFN